MAVASGAPMKMGSVRPSPSDSCSRSTGVFDCRSTRTARSRTSTMPANLLASRPTAISARDRDRPDAPAGSRGMSPVSRPSRSCSGAGAARPGAAGPAGSFVRRLDGRGPGPRVPLPDEGEHDLLHESRLPVGGVLVEPQVAGLDPELGEPAATWPRPGRPRRSTRCRRPTVAARVGRTPGAVEDVTIEPAGRDSSSMAGWPRTIGRPVPAVRGATGPLGRPPPATADPSVPPRRPPRRRRSPAGRSWRRFARRAAPVRGVAGAGDPVAGTAVAGGPGVGAGARSAAAAPAPAGGPVAAVGGDRTAPAAMAGGRPRRFSGLRAVSARTTAGSGSAGRTSIRSGCRDRWVSTARASPAARGRRRAGRPPALGLADRGRGRGGGRERRRAAGRRRRRRRWRRRTCDERRRRRRPAPGTMQPPPPPARRRGVARRTRAVRPLRRPTRRCAGGSTPARHRHGRRMRRRRRAWRARRRAGP